MSSSKEIDQVINHSPASRELSRRAFLGKATFFLSSGIALGLGLDVLHTVKKGIIDDPPVIREVEEQTDSLYPPVTYKDKADADKRIMDLETTVSEATKKGNVDRVNEIITSEEFQDAYLTKYRVKALYDIRYTARSQLLLQKGVEPTTTFLKGFMEIIGGTAAGIMGFWSKYSVDHDLPKLLADQREHMHNAVSILRPEWSSNQPAQNELNSFYQCVSYLPPVGGKISLIVTPEGNSGINTLDPSWLAEEQVENINDLRQKGRLGQAYVHQLTVQGRLPDAFKYAALALILHSPYTNDWSNPMVKAHWGSVAPMVHDGGVVDRSINYLWKKVKGRTDFLQRVVLVKESNLENLENLSQEERSQLSVDVLSKAREEQEERERLLLEARAYQRLALALHAERGSIPRAIPGEVRKKLASHWSDFQSQMQNLLEQYGIEGAAKETWFTEKPRYFHDWSGKRREGSWQPIQKQLIKLERIRAPHPEIRERVKNILQQVTNNIDSTIGLKAA